MAWFVSDRYGRLYALMHAAAARPGLAKKRNGCMPPGHAKTAYNVGQRYDRNFGTTRSYNQIPDYLRDQYRLRIRDDRYYYRQRLCAIRVDPRTMLSRSR